jgi:vanillate O-demethylase ferredoxin subunit
VHARTVCTAQVVALDLRAQDGIELPHFTPGSHIDIELPVRDSNGHFMVRQYSLSNDSAETHRYVIGVGRDASSRGGSVFLHDQVEVGASLRISTPRNHFPLQESAQHSVMVAGGIGITPLLAMARRLSTLGKAWTLYYCARTPAHAAFLDELQGLPGTVITVFDGVPDGKPIDLPAVVRDAPVEAHLYCCGPASLMQAFEAAASGCDPAKVHVEWFKPRPTAAPTSMRTHEDAPFPVHLARSGKTLGIPPDKSILDVLLEAGIAVPHSCCDGVCGTCETRVLEGIPDHRDSVLFGEDAKATDKMMVCISRSKSAGLTLDL